MSPRGSVGMERAEAEALDGVLDGDGGGHVRGIDVFRVRDALVAEKLSYVKG